MNACHLDISIYLLMYMKEKAHTIQKFILRNEQADMMYL
jgi:hypothetical protein